MLGNQTNTQMTDYGLFNVALGRPCNALGPCGKIIHYAEQGSNTGSSREKVGFLHTQGTPRTFVSKGKKHTNTWPNRD